MRRGKVLLCLKGVEVNNSGTQIQALNFRHQNISWPRCGPQERVPNNASDFFVRNSRSPIQCLVLRRNEAVRLESPRNQKLQSLRRMPNHRSVAQIQGRCANKRPWRRAMRTRSIHPRGTDQALEADRELAVGPRQDLEGIHLHFLSQGAKATTPGYRARLGLITQF